MTQAHSSHRFAFARCLRGARRRCGRAHPALPSRRAECLRVRRGRRAAVAGSPRV